jgi:hypothetical protein
MDELAYPYIQVGDEITFDTVVGHTGVTGTVVALHIERDEWQSVSLLQPGHEEVFNFKANLISVWRKGKPVQRIDTPNLQVPNIRSTP